jgi:hypothetical protein
MERDAVRLCRNGQPVLKNFIVMEPLRREPAFLRARIIGAPKK